MIINPESVTQLIEKELPEAQIDIRSDDNVHFEGTVISAAFAGKPTLQRHRMVYAGLGELMGREIHALSLKTLTPEEAA